MKKYLLVCIMALLCIIPTIGASNVRQKSKTDTNLLINPLSEFTHTVLAEYATTTKCGYCPTASSQLYSIYNSKDYNFYFVTFVADVNYKIYNRVKELGVISVPDVYFDGGYRNELGAKPDEQPYRNAIVQSGERQVPAIDIDVSVEWKGNSIIKINVIIQNNEAEEYNGHLRVYIVEPESRWNDASGKPYHFGVLHIPVDKSLALPQVKIRPLTDTYTFSKTWFGALYGFGDITKDNIMVIATVFDKDTKYAVQTASAEPTDSSINLLQFIASRSIMKLVQFACNQGIFSHLYKNLT